MAEPLALDVHGRASLDGVWEFYPGDHPRAALDGLDAEPITVPGLWEAQGHLELDGVAWYRRRFTVAEVNGHWILRFAAVMDLAEVYLNGELLGRHEHPFTPFELDATALVRLGENVLDVRVVDPAVDDPLHIRLAHGKQGWANHVFPSRPSLYMTYGGIWQSVTLRRHGAVVTRDVFVNADPDDLVVTAEVTNIGASTTLARVGLRAIGMVHEEDVALAAGETRTVRWQVGHTGADRWRPESPVLHELLVDVQTGGALSDRRHIRFGLRTVRVDGNRILINDEPYRMKSVLVQGFRAEQLYAEGDRAQIEEEVLAARDMGFNTLRLHIKAFDPTYLDVCDELGMLLHCDLPVAEPIAHEELGDGTPLSRRAVEAVTEQVRRDRNHPSIVLWSAMNELGLDREGARETDAYEQFARTLYAAVAELDPTRPVIENDWVEPDPDRVFSSPILSAHWYGRLHADYLDALEAKVARWSDTGRPLYVTEFGDWGLPAMPPLEHAPFWDTRELYAADLAWSRWPSTVPRFILETQRYQGISDRLQMEIFRRHDHLGGYCLTELTDVPHELNGVLDLHRRPKRIAVEEVRRANQTRLPMLRLSALVVVPGETIHASLHISNDGPPLPDAAVQVRFGDALAAPPRRIGDVAGYTVSQFGTVKAAAPDVEGNHDLIVVLYSGGETVAQNRYPVHVVARPEAPYPVEVLGDARTAGVLADLGARRGDGGPVVVAEGTLDADIGAAVTRRLQAGRTVVMLAQHPPAAGYYPLPVELTEMETAWGSSVFHYTTDSGGLPSLPRRNLLVGEDSTIQAMAVLTRVDGAVFPAEPAVIAYKPMPGAITGTVVGLHRIGSGRLIMCQYRLVQPAHDGDAAARALLADLVRWAADPRPPLAVTRVRTNDGRTLTYYTDGSS